MLVGYVNSSDSNSTTTSVNEPIKATQTNNTLPSSSHLENWARLVSEYAYANEPSTSSNTTTAPTSTFGSNPNPAYDLNAPSDLNSNNGRVAANGLLRLEQFGPEYNPQDEAQFVSQTLGQHKNDPQFLQQYLGTLGSGRVAQIFSYLASPGAVQTPETSISGQAPQQLRHAYQNVANALTTLVNSKDFSQSDMDQFVAEYAKTNPQVNFFAKEVLSQASPQVNHMFFQSAKNYALQNSGNSEGQSMAAYAMQALSQTSNPLPELENLPNNQLSTLVQAAMKGEAAYGNPPSIDEFAKTGVFRAQNGQGDKLNGLTNLMFDAAYADAGDQFSPAPLSTSKAQDLQTKLFEAAIGTLQSDPAVKSFYDNQSTSSQGVSMKDALAVEFQQGYDSIIKYYSQGTKDGGLNVDGLKAFREFFADAIFSPPPSSYALGAVQTIQSKTASYIAQANRTSSTAPLSQQQHDYGRSLGEQVEAMAAGLQESLDSILQGAAQADQSTQKLLDEMISLGGSVAGTAGGPVGFGSAILGQALTLLVDSHPGSGPADVQAALSELKGHGIDVSRFDQYGIYTLNSQIGNYPFQDAFQGGWSAADMAFNPGQPDV